MLTSTSISSSAEAAPNIQVQRHWRSQDFWSGGAVNFYVHHRICLSRTLITARTVASLKKAKGNQFFFRRHRLSSVRVVEKSERGERSFAV